MIKKALTPLLALSIVIFLQACGGASGSLNSTMTVKGTILIKGHLPHSFVALKVSSRRYYNLVGRYSRVLRSSYQGKKVIVTGKIVAEALGPGMPARMEVTSIDKIVSRR